MNQERVGLIKKKGKKVKISTLGISEILGTAMVNGLPCHGCFYNFPIFF